MARRARLIRALDLTYLALMPNDKKPIFTYGQGWAAGFDTRMQVVVPGYNLMHSIVGSFLQATIAPESNILVIGAGTGTDIISLGAYNSEWRITGIDPSPEMLEIAREKIAAANLHRNVRLESCKIEDFEGTSLYDVAILSLVLQLYPNDGSKLKLLRAVARHLKPEGVFVLIDSYGDYGTAQFERTLESLQIQTTRRGLTTEEAEKDIESIRSRFYFISEQRIRSLLRRADFDCIELIFHAFITGVWLAHLSTDKPD